MKIKAEFVFLFFLRTLYFFSSFSIIPLRSEVVLTLLKLFFKILTKFIENYCNIYSINLFY